MARTAGGSCDNSAPSGSGRGRVFTYALDLGRRMVGGVSLGDALEVVLGSDARVQQVVQATQPSQDATLFHHGIVAKRENYPLRQHVADCRAPAPPGWACACVFVLESARAERRMR